MTLAPGTRLGPYEITAMLGEGGMGQVWRARDSQLGRDVALKVLPEGFTQDPERLARFEREAKLLAQLNHPSIAQIYGLEVSGDVRALVMELVEGPTLAERLEQGSLPFTECLSISLQIAQALEEAHEKGIVHRDLKPQNVKASIEGKVKVLDFGLAKLLDPLGGPGATASEIARSPTVSLGVTVQGTILGTASYMAPEQARGLSVDKRADIWAFGVVLYEMLVGKRLFDGELVSDVLAAVLTKEIAWGALPPSTPAELRRLLRRCLERTPRNRLHDIADARIVLAEVAAAPDGDPGAAAHSPFTRRRLGMAGLGLVALGAAAGALVAVALARRTQELARTGEASIVASIPPPAGTSYYLSVLGPGTATLTRDGSRLVFAAVDSDAVVRLHVREMATGVERALAGTEGAQYPFWSDDGRWVGYFSEREVSLKKIAADGGAPITICEAPDGKGGTWNRDGVILFTPDAASPIRRVSSHGGESAPITSLESGRFNSHRRPSFLPDGRRFIYFARAPDAKHSVVMVASLDGGTPTELVASETQAEYAAGHLLFLREGTLMAQRFDPRSTRLEGAPEAILSGIAATAGAGVAHFSASETALVAHRGTIQQPVQLELRDRSGRLLERLASAGAEVRDLAFAPDGARVAYSRREDIHLLDLERRTEERFTLDAGEEVWPIWTPGGDGLYFSANRKGPFDIYRKSITGAGQEELVLDLPEAVVPGAVSPDGKTLLFVRYEPGAKGLWSLDLASGRSARLLEREIFTSRVAFSPNGRWVLFVALGDGQAQVFATPFPGPGRIVQVSANGGAIPFWIDAGREIVYLDRLGAVVSVPVVTGGEALELGAPRPLFQALPPQLGSTNFAVSPDGQRFLLAHDGTIGAANELAIVTDWTSRLGLR